MPHRIEVSDGVHLILMSGEITAAESRDYFRAVTDLLRRGPVSILLSYGQGCVYLAGPRETLQHHIAVAESLKGTVGGAVAFLCRDDAIFGICRQFQILASGSGVKLAVFRDGPLAEAWLAAPRRVVEIDTLRQS